ncbi:MAG TPA: acyl-CoA dehydrogenase [Xanthomonadaceae bacterium]|nr:acyl-CoA dehydrogenase [Xanthomonadaceae bacterium]
MTMLVAVAVALVLVLVLMYHGLALLAYLAATTALLVGWRLTGVESPTAFAGTIVVLAAIAAVFGLPPLRRVLISSWLIQRMAKVLPRLGETERVALDAGTVWWDADLFSGKPDWRKLLDYRLPPLSEEEEAFLAGPVEELCRSVDDWQVYQRRDLAPETWDFLRRQGFFGMIIPKEYGGLGFSGIGHSRVVTKIASRSVTAAVTVMVPNSLGPAELLLHYGTEEQKRHYLPRLASGQDIPCFALTGPEAGSDAAATQSEGIVERRSIGGRDVIGMRLNWYKRYITLAPVATLIGLAFRLKDPDGLLGGELDRGITVALIGADTPGIVIGDRHDPMGVPFMNGPITGQDVFVPIDAILGGEAGIGNGWRMLMESLAAGRTISLPALSVGCAQIATRVVGAYATVREQFDTPIGRFEGIEEPLARIAGKTYLMTAARTLTCAAIDLGEKPSVLSAIVKYYLTEGMRQVVSDAMDIRAGAAIQRGPRNILANAWQAVPIGITVEGANILTRSMIIYGQGAIRCHPFVQHEIRSVAENDVKGFDRAVFGHATLVARNKVRAWLLALTSSRIAGVPAGDLHRELQHLTRFSAAFGFVSDMAMGALGGTLKRREKTSGRLADVLGWMYLASATIKRYEDEKKQDNPDPAALDLARWSCWLALYEIQQALGGVIDNFPVGWMRLPLKWIVFPLGRHFRYPGDRMGSRVARSILEDRRTRLHLTGDIFVPPPHEPGLGSLEKALDEAVAALPIEAKLRDAVRAGKIDRAPGHMLDDIGLAAGVITREEYDRLNAARDCRDEVIKVDSFGAREYLGVH